MRRKLLVYITIFMISFANVIFAKIPKIALGPPVATFEEGTSEAWVSHPELWKNVAKKSKIVLTFDGAIISKGWIKPVDAKALVETAKKLNLGIAIEFSLFAAPVAVPSEGKTAADILVRGILQPIYDAGGEVHSVFLDGADYRLLEGLHKRGEGCGLTVEQYAQEMVIFWKTVHELDPMIKICPIEDPKAWEFDKETPCFFDGYTSKSGVYMKDSLDALYKALTEAGETIPIISLDCPYPYYNYKKSQKGEDIDTKQAILKIQKWCAERKIEMMYIVNTEPKFGGKLEEMSESKKEELNEHYREDCLKYIEMIYNDGIQPDWIMLESWYHVPTKNVPETEDGTFFNITNECIDLINALYKKPWKQK